MRTEFKEGGAFTFVLFFEIEDILVKRDGLLDVVHFNRDMIAAINLHAHSSEDRASLPDRT
jgi:hypothetical protein